MKKLLILLILIPLFSGILKAQTDSIPSPPSAPGIYALSSNKQNPFWNKASMYVFEKDTIATGVYKWTYQVDTTGVYQLSGYIAVQIAQPNGTAVVNFTYKNKFNIPESYTYGTISIAQLYDDNTIPIREFTAIGGSEIVMNIKCTGVAGIGLEIKQLR